MANVEIPEWKVQLLIKKRLRDQGFNRRNVTSSVEQNSNRTKIGNGSLNGTKESTDRRIEAELTSSRIKGPRFLCDHLNSNYGLRNRIESSFSDYHNTDETSLSSRKEPVGSNYSNQSTGSFLCPVAKEDMGDKDDNVIYEHIIPKAVKRLWLKQESHEETEPPEALRTRSTIVEQKAVNDTGRLRELDFGNVFVSHDVKEMNGSNKSSIDVLREKQRRDSISEKQEYPAAAHTWGVKLRHVVTKEEKEVHGELSKEVPPAEVVYIDSNKKTTLASLLQNKQGKGFNTTNVSQTHGKSSLPKSGYGDNSKDLPQDKYRGGTFQTPVLRHVSSNPSSSLSTKQESKQVDKSIDRSIHTTHKATNNKSSWSGSMLTPVVSNSSSLGSHDSLVRNVNLSTNKSLQNENTSFKRDVKSLSAVDLSKVDEDDVQFKSVRERRQSFENILDDNGQHSIWHAPAPSTVYSPRQQNNVKNSKIKVKDNENHKSYLSDTSDRNKTKVSSAEAVLKGKYSNEHLLQKEDGKEGAMITEPTNNGHHLLLSKGEKQEHVLVAKQDVPSQSKGNDTLSQPNQSEATQVTSASFVKDAVKRQNMAVYKESPISNDILKTKGGIREQKGFENEDKILITSVNDSKITEKPLITQSNDSTISQPIQSISHLQSSNTDINHNLEKFTSVDKNIKATEGKTTINQPELEWNMGASKDLSSKESPASTVTLHQTNQQEVMTSQSTTKSQPRKKGLFVIQSGDDKDRERNFSLKKVSHVSVDSKGNTSTQSDTQTLNGTESQVPVTNIDTKQQSSSISDHSGHVSGKVLSFTSNSLIKGWEAGDEYEIPEVVFDGPVEDIKSIMNPKSKNVTDKGRGKVSFKSDELFTIHSYPSEESLLSDGEKSGFKPTGVSEFKGKEHEGEYLKRPMNHNSPSLDELNGKLQQEVPSLEERHKPSLPVNEAPPKRTSDASDANARFHGTGPQSPL